MRDIDLFFENPAVLLAAIPAVLFVAAAERLLRREKEIARADRVAAVLRAAAVILLAVIAAGPGVTRYSHNTETVILADRSGSMAPAMAQMDAWIEAAKQDADESVRVVDFAAAPAAEGNEIDPTGTDIAAAVRAGMAAFTGDEGRRMILLSDGVPTEGDVMAAVQEAVKAGIRLDAVRMKPVFPSPQTEVASFELPYEVRAGRHIEANVTVLSDTQTEGVLRIYDGGAAVHEENVEIVPGRQVFSCVLRADDAGLHEFCAELTVQDDMLPENNRMSARMNVSRSEKILLVDGTGSESEQLAQLLREDGAEVTVVSAEDVPGSVSQLCEYGLIVLMNVHVNDLPDGWDQTLAETVSEYGRSVLTTGGENTYLYGGMKDSPYEELLPVRMSAEEKESVEPMSLMLVMDVTDSMTRESIGVPIDMARRGAIKCIEELNSNDYAGVITFSDDAELTVEMTSMRDKEPVLQVINEIQTADPNRLTRFTGALRLACDTLKEFDGTQRKHVMFITDGSPADAKEGFRQIAQEMRAEDITLSTIVVGRIVNVVNMLEELAAIGGGRCYLVESGKDLSSIMSVDSVLSQVEYTIEDAFKPQRGTYDAAFAGGEELVQLFGYVRTTAKSDADVSLKTAEGRPIYAKRSVGAGTAASFMSDLSGNWSRVWFASEQGKATILSMIGSLLPEALSGAADDGESGRTREYDLLSAPDGGTLLMELCAEAGGTVFETWEEAAAVQMPPTAKPWDPVLPLSCAAMLCLLADIALRRTKRKAGKAA